MEGTARRIGRVCIRATWYDVLADGDGLYGLEGVDGRIDADGLRRLQDGYPYVPGPGEEFLSAPEPRPEAVPPGPRPIDPTREVEVPAATPEHGKPTSRRLAATPGEQDLLRFRPHWAYVAIEVLKLLVVELALLAVNGYMARFAGQLVSTVGTLELIALVGMQVLTCYWWWNARYYLTTHRVGRDVYGILLRTRSKALRISRVTAVSSRVPLLGALLGYGDVRVAAGQDLLVLGFVPDARRVAAAIEALVARMEDGQTQMVNRVAGFEAVTCPACHLPQPAGASYCGDCGASLGHRCRECGTPVAGAYCGNCGEAA